MRKGKRRTDKVVGGEMSLTEVGRLAIDKNCFRWAVKDATSYEISSQSENVGVILISDWIVSKGFYIESTDVSKRPVTFIKIHLNEKMRARSKKQLYLRVWTNDRNFN